MKALCVFTFEELFEAVTWTQLGIHRKPVGLLNLEGYYDLILGFLDSATDHGFVRKPLRSLIVDHSTPGGILELLDHHELPETRRWPA